MPRVLAAVVKNTKNVAANSPGRGDVTRKKSIWGPKLMVSIGFQIMFLARREGAPLNKVHK